MTPRSAKLIQAKRCHAVTLSSIESAQSVKRINPEQREQIRVKVTLMAADGRDAAK